jgi:hypothetical protein
MVQLSFKPTNRKMKLPFCVYYKFQAPFSHVHILDQYCLIPCLFSAQQKMLQNFGSFPLFYCNAGVEVEDTRLKRDIVTYQTIKTKEWSLNRRTANLYLERGYYMVTWFNMSTACTDHWQPTNMCSNSSQNLRSDTCNSNLFVVWHHFSTEVTSSNIHQIK